MLPIFIVCFLLGACSKLDVRYGFPKINIENNEAYHNGSVVGYLKPSLPWNQEFFKAIREIDIHSVLRLLHALDTGPEDDWVNKLIYFDVVDMCTCLHIAAENIKDNAVHIMKCLLDKMLPLLLNKEGRESLLCEKGKIQHFVQGNSFWNENNIEKFLNYLESQGYNNSVLLSRNARQETPLLVAMKRGSVNMVKLLLEYTHKYVGLNHAAHIDEDENDFLDIALQQKDNHKLDSLMDELCNCSARSAPFTCIHFLGMAKCQSEAVIGAMLSSKKKLFYLFKAVHNNKLERIKLLLDAIVTVLGPVACSTAFIKKCPEGPPGYTLLHTALDKNFLGEEDKCTVKFLLSTLKGILPGLSDPIKQELIDLLVKGRTESPKSIPSLLELAEEHGYPLTDFYMLLRMLIDSISPLGEFYPLLPPSNWYKFPLSNHNNVNLVLVR